MAAFPPAGGAPAPLGYRRFAARAALDIEPRSATGPVALDVMLGIVLSVLAAGMLS